MNDERLWERWDEVDALLERTLDQPPTERGAFLAQACGADQALLGLLQRLVRSSEEADEPPGPSAALVRAALTDPPADEAQSPATLEGSTIGVYRLGGVLGVGGMGAVYLGERVDGVFERQVAVKVLHRWLGASGVAERFRQERRILASLNHHGIAQLIDGGVTGDGQPYLVMEHVAGLPIDRYAHEHGLGVDERIRLVLQAAHAIEHAHRRMVVHLDLKPSNMLVSGDGRVKLLDFGIAKLLRPADDPAEPALTRADSRFVTPEYAAPEQLLGEEVSTQTDVYGLAAVLYELLTGVRPYGSRGAQSVLERVVAGDEPTSPSAAVADTEAHAGLPAGGTGPAELSARPETLRRRLAGDLDAILLRALRARAEERYSSMAAFRDDLERHLAGRAVLARGDARLYRARRFVRRHRLAVGALAATFLVVAGSAAGLAVQRGALLTERNRATMAAAAAARDAETAHQVTNLLVGLLEAGDPRARTDTLTVAALLERGAERVDTELAGQPAVRAELLDVLGRVYGSMGRHEQATAMLNRAVALREDTLPGRPGLAASLLWLGDVRRDERAFEPAVAAYRRAFDEARLAGLDSLAAEARLGMAHAFLQQDLTDSAEFAFQGGLAMLDSLPQPPEMSRLNALLGLGGLLRRRDDLDGAATLYQQVIERRRRLPDGDAMDLATALNNLAITRRMQGAYDDAATLYLEALDTATTILGAGHPTTLMFAGNLARAWFDAGRPDLGLDTYRARVAAARQQWPDGDWRLAEMLMNLGASLLVAGRDQEAIAPLTEAVAMLEAELEPGHSWTAVYRAWLGAAAALAGRDRLAREAFDRSFATLSRYAGLRQDPNVPPMLEALVREIEKRGLKEPAARYRSLLEPATE